ncbi:undecaprenyl-diphosphatase UppP [Candidatus Saccharibacteria bacterium]|nr:undecaprenyl-diphosphatase UppP [Candidatus Saccharibacteria bacterium]MBI3337873.1 undecaprenyl-diphosphatase UppP [Candidatus Saccharibacteria bacterium]
MNIIQAIILGLVQGLTEFIPVSSSGHLVLMHQALGITENGLTFDVALHLGTLLALIIFFYKELWQLFQGILGKNNLKHLAWLLVLATVPAVIVGVLLESAAESAFRSVNLVAINLLLVAFIMLGAEWYAKRYRHKTKLEKVTIGQAAGIGLAQAVAIIPGVSRSGSTITAGLFMGMDRVAATRFSFLLGIPITAGAIGKVLISENSLNLVQNEISLFAVGIITAFLSGLFAIGFLLKYLAKHTLAVFACYRIALAVIVLTVTFFV